MSSGERPIGAAKGKESDTEALCQPPTPPMLHGHSNTSLPGPHPFPGDSRRRWCDDGHRSAVQ